MPQPLSRVRPGANIGPSNDAMDRYPSLALWISKVISMYAAADVEWPGIAAVIKHTSPETFVAIHNDLKSDAAQRAMVKAVAKEYLEAAEMKLLQAVEKAIKPARDIRNRFAHHLWGTSPEVPDALLLIEPAPYIRHLAWYVGMFDRKQDASTRPEIPYDRIMVYRESDMRSAYEVVMESELIFRKLRMCLDRGWSKDGMRAYANRARGSAHCCTSHEHSRQENVSGITLETACTNAALVMRNAPGFSRPQCKTSP